MNESKARRIALVVDDEPDIRLLARRQLERVEFAVLEAEGGAEALELLLGGLRPDVVLLDLRMPGIDGLEVVKELSAKRLLEEVPVIVFSAHGCGALVDELLCLGCRDCIKKPYTGQQLTDALAAAA